MFGEHQNLSNKIFFPSFIFDTLFSDFIEIPFDRGSNSEAPRYLTYTAKYMMAEAEKCMVAGIHSTHFPGSAFIHQLVHEKVNDDPLTSFW